MHNIVQVFEKQDELCKEILKDLPAWFGIQSAIDGFASQACHNPFFVCFLGDRPTGIMMVENHNAIHAELALITVKEDCHGRGIGTALLAHVVAFLKAEHSKTAFLSVKTLDPCVKDAAYLKTYAFYKKAGFEDFEKLPQLWDEHNPCLMMVKHL